MRLEGFSMAKTYIDIPQIGYKTWLITTGIIKDGKFVEDEENDLIADLRKKYPYSHENSHVTR